MDILIKNMGLPTEGKQIRLTILSDGSVVEHLPDGGGKWRSYRSGGVKAVALPEHGRLGDLDLVEEWMRKKHKENDCPFNIDAFLFALKKFPTIVEANYGTDN